MRQLVCFASGGLGNRILSLLSLYLWSERLGREFVIAWTPSAECDAEFADLFELSRPGIAVVNESYIETLDDLVICADKENALKNLSALFGQSVLERKIEAGVPWLPTSAMESRPRQNLVVVHDRPVRMTTNDLHGASALLRPSKAVQEVMARLPRKVDSTWTGVHYRATDRKGYPYREWRLRGLVRRGPVFVCSDDPAIESKAAKLSGVFVLPKDAYAQKVDQKEEWSSGWNVVRSRQSVIEAVADLYVLSRTGRMLGTESSSFFKTAKLFGGKRVHDTVAPLRRLWRFFRR